MLRICKQIKRKTNPPQDYLDFLEENSRSQEVQGGSTSQKVYYDDFQDILNIIALSSNPLNMLLNQILEESRPEQDKFPPLHVKKILENFYGDILADTNIIMIIKRFQFDQNGMISLDALCNFIYNIMQGQNLLKVLL